MPGVGAVVSVKPSSQLSITTSREKPVPIVLPTGQPGPPGEDAKWARMTQAEYDALNPKDPQTLYVIIG
jgi:hypothetical protein